MYIFHCLKTKVLDHAVVACFWTKDVEKDRFFPQHVSESGKSKIRRRCKVFSSRSSLIGAIPPFELY